MADTTAPDDTHAGKTLPRWLLVVIGVALVGAACVAWQIGHVGVRWLAICVAGAAFAVLLARAAAGRKRAQLEQSLDAQQLRQSLRPRHASHDAENDGDTDD